MKLSSVKNSAIFKGMSEKEIQLALTSLRYEEKFYKKGETILHAGSTTRKMGIVLSGSVTIENIDILGNKTILSHVSVGDFFAETYAFLTNEPMAVDVCANENCKIFFLNIGNITASYPSGSESWKTKLIANLLTISTQKNLLLSNRIFHTTSKTIRGKLISYLSFISVKKQKNEFKIPFDRQQLADYLNVDRTALSKEIGKMQKEGLIICKKNHFILKDRMNKDNILQ